MFETLDLGNEILMCKETAQLALTLEILDAIDAVTLKKDRSQAHVFLQILDPSKTYLFRNNMI